jgi:hypothetical protein
MFRLRKWLLSFRQPVCRPKKQSGYPNSENIDGEFPPLAILFIALGIIIFIIFLTFYMKKMIGSKK